MCDVDATKLGNGRNAKLAHHITKLIKQDFTGMLTTMPAKRGDSIEEGPANQDKISTRGNRLGHIEA